MTSRGRLSGSGGSAGRKAPSRSWGGPWAILALMTGGVVLVAAMLVSGLGRSGGSGEGEEFPAYAYNSSATLAGYKVAVRVPEALAVVPCYCGCGPAQGHTSLKDCFLASNGAFTDHASNCHLCVEEAVDVGKWYDEGQTLKVIRAAIEEKYSDSGPGTDTPPVS